eukprot:NODE_3900_length_1145_cov_12.035225_g3710_i0.p1 GENE.NODE_3900_length_1145_cov_12.035225_g3710_i0~~NODE_3900_length_1145_cov_12.035225_g3710_i0.p1  ORF type:complete len:315 (-),score=79.17 NODE_3900_length_1145_cov_12.035225_g3710_i0:111-1055(-)
MSRFGRAGRRPTYQSRPTRESNVDNEYSKLLHSHKEAQQQRERAKLLQTELEKQRNAGDRKGPIKLDPVNKLQYDKQGFNVELAPFPTSWQHDDLRRLLQRVNAPEPVAWNISNFKQKAWLDYDYPKHQREAIDALDNIQLPGGQSLRAIPVEAGNKKRTAFYRECDDGRVPNEEDRPATTIVVNATTEASSTPAATETPSADAADEEQPTKKRRGRGFQSASVQKLHADDPAKVAMEKALADRREREKAMANNPELAKEHEETSERIKLHNANAVLVNKYKIILKRLTEKERNRSVKLKALAASKQERRTETA